MPRIHVTGRLDKAAPVRIEGDKAHHLRNVLRLRPGAPLVVFDGNGGEYLARVLEVERAAVTAALEEYRPVDRESPLRLLLAQAVARGERMDFAVAKAVELGVDAVQPVFTARGQVRLDGRRQDKKLDHWRRVAIGAAEQCGRDRVPEIHQPLKLEAWLAQPPPSGTCLVLDPAAADGIGTVARARNATLLVGPESGLTEDEVTAARAAGFAAVRLGPRVLRTETAGPAALAALQALWGDLG